MPTHGLHRLLSIGLILVLSVVDARESVAVESCRGDPRPAPVEVRWIGAPGHVASGTMLELRVETTRPGATSAEVEIRLSGDGQWQQFHLTPISLYAGAGSARVDPNGLGMDLSLVQYSASLEVMVRFMAADGNELGKAQPPILYLHPSERGLWVYDEQALYQDHSGGDYQGLHGTSAGMRRIYDAGRGMEAGTIPTLDDLVLPAPFTGHRLCFQYEYSWLDSDLGEALYRWPMGLMRARGVHVQVEFDGHPLFDGFADPDTGCVDIPKVVEGVPVVGGLDIVVSARVRLHDPQVDVGETFRVVQTGVLMQWAPQLVTDGMGKFYVPLSNSHGTSALAATSQTYHRIHSTTLGGLLFSQSFIVDAASDKYLTESLCAVGCTIGNTLHFNSAGHDDVCHEKFGVGHEVGHFLHKSYGISNDSGASYDDDMDQQDAGSCAFTGVGGHAMRSLEISNAAMVEGFAHYLAALAWNGTHVEDGAFVYYKSGPTELTSPVDQASYADMAADQWVVSLEGEPDVPVPLGGVSNYRDNVCALAPGYVLLTGWETEMDWLRFFWDLRTDPPGPDNGNSLKPSHAIVFEFLALAHPSGYGASQDVQDAALAALPAHFPAGFGIRVLAAAAKNGVSPL